MFNRLFSVLLALSVSLSAHAALPEGLSVSASAEYVSSYVFRGDKIAADAIQPSVTVEFGSAYATVWGSRAFRSDGLDETDFTFGYTLGALDAGVTAYTYEGDSSSSSWEGYVGLSHEIKGVEVSAYAYHDWILHSYAFEGKIARSFSLIGSLSVGLSAAIGNAHGRDVPSYTYWVAKIAPSYQVNEGLSVEAGVAYHSTGDVTHSRDQWVYSAVVGYSF